MSRKLEAMFLSGTGFSLCVCLHGGEEKLKYIRQNAVKRALVEHPDSYKWLFFKSITG